MNRSILLVAVVAMVSAQAAWSQPYKSRTAGFFAGGGLEADVINVKTNDAPTKAGGGLGVLVGYGFSRRWSIYAQVSGARMTSTDDADYSLAHLDLGTRVHLRSSGNHMIVPFLQVALTGRRVADDLNGTDVSNSGGGLTAGGGFNAHFTPAVAFSTSANVTIGTFDTFTVGGRSLRDPSASIGATTFRVLFAAIWFPQPNRPPRTLRGS